MKNEVEFVKSMTEKLRWQGDVTADEAMHIFLLAVVAYAYEMGALEGRYKNSFGGKFDCAELSSALGEWYETVFARISDKPKYYNFIASIPSREACPVFKYMENDTSYMIKAMDKLSNNKKRALQRIFKTSEHVYFKANEKMTTWIKNSVPLSFDVLCYYGVYGSSYSGMDFARFGLVSSLPTYEREIKKEKLQALFDINIPFLQGVSYEVSSKQEADTCSVICPLEYKDVLDAVADDLPIPEIPQEKASAHVPKDIKYINLLTDRLPFQDITEEEADNIYLLFKVYQALRIAALKGDERLKEQTQKATEPGLNALASWYKAVERELEKGKRGNFVYTLPSNLDMNLYQLRKPMKACLEMLPEEPTKIAARNKEDLPIKDIFLDTKCTAVTWGSNNSISCETSRYGFFERNGVSLNEWIPVLQHKGHSEDFILNGDTEDTVLGKLRFAEYSLGIKYIIIENKIAVKEKDYQKTMEVLKLSDGKIMEAAELIKQKKKEEGVQNVEPLEYIIKGVEMVYKAQKAQEEYFEENDWMEIDR